MALFIVSIMNSNITDKIYIQNSWMYYFNWYQVFLYMINLLFDTLCKEYQNLIEYLSISVSWENIEKNGSTIQFIIYWLIYISFQNTKENIHINMYIKICMTHPNIRFPLLFKEERSCRNVTFSHIVSACKQDLLKKEEQIRE